MPPQALDATPQAKLLLGFRSHRRVAADMVESCLFYVVGPSGAGKDSVIGGARAHLDTLPAERRPPVVFAHRYITRPANAGGENHVALSDGEFALRRAHDCFALDWDSHGLTYGIGREIEGWLKAGLSVVVNGSRGYLDTAAARFPQLVPVAITVNTEALRARLIARGRETPAEIEERLTGATRFRVAHPRLATIDNSGALSEAIDEFSRLLDAGTHT